MAGPTPAAVAAARLRVSLLEKRHEAAPGWLQDLAAGGTKYDTADSPLATVPAPRVPADADAAARGARRHR